MAIWSFSLSQIIGIEVPQFEIWVRKKFYYRDNWGETNILWSCYANFPDDWDLTEPKINANTMKGKYDNFTFSYLTVWLSLGDIYI